MCPETNNEAVEREQKPKEHLTDNLVETHHQVNVQGRTLAYTVTAGTIILKEETKISKTNEKTPDDFVEPKAVIFFVAYTLDSVEAKKNRPITFSFNGGPGSSSVWLHLGLLGPRRVALDENGFAPPPPYSMVENEYSLLDTTDLVFIDPVSTGYSRAVPGENPETYHGFQKDIESVGDFIRLYTTRYQRWSSPKFLIGESYGTTRAAGLSGYLQENLGMYLNGIMLISAVLNFQTHDFHAGNDLPFITFLPTYASTAWYHRKLPDELQRLSLRELLDEVEAFVDGPYTSALMKGAGLPEAERQAVQVQIARYTGLSEAYIDQTNLRINIFQFVKELLRNQKRTVGRLDTRFTGVDRNAVGENFEFDPSYSNIQGPYTAALNDYVRRELAFESDLPYEILTERVRPWSYKEHENRYVDVAETLRSAMSMNPFLKIYIANGYFDLATPYRATEYTINHLELDPTLQPNIRMGYYDAGHMMYIHLPSLVRLRDDLVNFIQESVPLP